MLKILLATGNPGKKKEILECFASLKGQIQWCSLKDFPPIPEPEENGSDFETNAAIKAEYFGKAHNILTLSEDSGLSIEAFPDKFGVRTKREFTAKDDMDWMTQFLDLMDGEDNREAHFYSAFALFDPKTGKSQTTLGGIGGEIAEFPMAPLEPGIPVSSVFMPEGYSEAYSAMTKKQKSTISHRGRSAALMIKILQDTIATQAV